MARLDAGKPVHPRAWGQLAYAPAGPVRFTPRRGDNGPARRYRLPGSPPCVGTAYGIFTLGPGSPVRGDRERYPR